MKCVLSAAARRPLAEKPIAPDYAIGSHAAPPGLLISDHNALPAKYQGGASISEPGRWDRSPLSGFQVVFVSFQQGKPVGKPEPSSPVSTRTTRNSWMARRLGC